MLHSSTIGALQTSCQLVMSSSGEELCTCDSLAIALLFGYLRKLIFTPIFRKKNKKKKKLPRIQWIEKRLLYDWQQDQEGALP